MSKICHKKIVISLLIALCFSVLLAFSSNVFVHADNTTDEVILPNDASEYYELSSPTDAFFWEENVAISQNPNTVLIYYKGEYKTPIKIQGATSLSQINRLSQDFLLVLNYNILYKISLTDFSASILYDDSGTPITCTHYDIKGNYLVTVSDRVGTARIYKVNGNSVSLQSDTIKDINGNKPIAIDGTNLIYVKDEKIYSRSIINTSGESTLLLDVNPDNLIVNASSIYYTISNSIYKVDKESLNNSEQPITPILLTVKNDYKDSDKYDLGNIETLSKISFRGDNLVVIDVSDNTIEEFSVNDDNTINFTGYAIADNKTSFNRIADCIDIQRAGKNVALLDNLRLMVINPDFENPYDVNRFTNLFVGDGIVNFALGLNGIVYSDGISVKFYDLTTKDDSQRIQDLEIEGEVVDIAYKCNKFYVICASNLDTLLYTIDETSLQSNTKTYTGQLFKIVEVDVFGNVYLADSTHLYKNGSKLTQLDGASKIQTDFVGNVFKCTNGNIFKLNNTSWVKLTQITEKVSCFTLSYDEQQVYYTLSNNDFVVRDNSLGNIAINSTQLPTDFVLTGTSADTDSLKTCNIFGNPNIFNVEAINGNFSFNRLTTKDSEYVYICDVKYNDDCIYKCLSGVNGLVLCESSNITNSTVDFTKEEQVMFITTSVHAYYYPLTTLDGIHYLSDGTNSVLLEKHSHISVLKKCTISNRDFYFAKINDNGVYGYVPLDFTVKTLSKHIPLLNYSIEFVYQTIAYTDEALSDAYKSLDDGEKVFLVQEKDEVSLVLIEEDDGFVACYISNSVIKNTPNIAIRNLLIILVVITCIAGTSTYFLLRKKSN